MVLSRNRIKFLQSLRIKKYRDIHQHFVAEGEKIITDAVKNHGVIVKEIVATVDWLEKNPGIQHALGREIIPATEKDFSRITTQDNPSGILALLEMPHVSRETMDFTGDIAIVLDDIQDPGNLGTIIRTASWFGIKRIFCSRGCADCFNPKVVQSSMGALLNVGIQYVELRQILSAYSIRDDVTIYGTFREGNSIWNTDLKNNAMIVFGNESKGISSQLLEFISVKLNVPSAGENRPGVIESLNVASAAAIVCAAFRK